MSYGLRSLKRSVGLIHQLDTGYISLAAPKHNYSLASCTITEDICAHTGTRTEMWTPVYPYFPLNFAWKFELSSP